jgi:hypothetical protein
MDQSEFDAKIAKLRSEVADIEQQMESNTKDFIVALTRFAQEWIDEDTTRMIGGNASHANALGVDGLKRLNVAIEGLKAKMRDLVEGEFLNKKYWVHRDGTESKGALDDDRYARTNDDKTPPHQFQEGLRSLTEGLHAIYDQAGFREITDRHTISQWSELISQTLRKYKQQKSKREGVLSAIQKTEAEKDRSLALELWRQAKS